MRIELEHALEETGNSILNRKQAINPYSCKKKKNIALNVAAVVSVECWALRGVVIDATPNWFSIYCCDSRLVTKQS